MSEHSIDSSNRSRFALPANSARLSSAMATESLLISCSSSPNKRLKTLIPNSFCPNKEEFGQYESEETQEKEEDDSQQRQLIVSTDHPDSLSCGICLSDNGNAIRGQIDSCAHLFCFVCIMEWAKVESRCPMCKRRFTIIRRPPKDGVFPSERVVNVLKRDQVYLLSGNTTVGPYDPYAQVQCSICHSSSDESLLLLCDLCDSAAHTYCVGLGMTVPEGDWFCHDCAVSKTEHENIQKDEDDINQNLREKSNGKIANEPCVLFDFAVNNQSTSETSNVPAIDNPDVSIFDIVCDSDDPFLARLRARSISYSHERQPNLSDGMKPPRTPHSDSDKVTQNGARTLSRCRNVQGYVRALRENWNALRSGSLRFSSTSTGSSGTNIGISNPLHDSSGQSHSLSSINGQQVTTNDGLHGIFTQDRRSHDVDKAWKMMDKGKSVKQACRKTKSVHCLSKNPSSKGIASRKATDGSSSLHLSRSQLLASTSLGNNSMTEKRYKLYSSGVETDKHLRLSKLRMQKHNRTVGKAIVNDNRPNSLHGFSASGASPKAQTNSQSNACCENWERLIQRNVCSASQNVTGMQDGSGSLMLVGTAPQASEPSNNKADLVASSFCNVHIPEGNVRMERVCTESKAGKDDDAKSEIQSLVKLNLKLLNGDKQLGVNGFKEIARLATHTILAACGFGHSRHVFHSFPRPVCNHTDQLQELRRSTLMKNSCRECFYIFVKDVVNSVLSDKLSQTGVTK